MAASRLRDMTRAIGQAKPRLVTWGVALAVLISGGLALDRAFAAGRAREARDAAVGDLRKATALAAKHPGSFGAQASAAGGEALKQLVQGSASLHSLLVAFLSENVKETGKHERERQVTARLTGANHRKLVAFLDDLERRGNGARVRELHLRPSPESSEAYQEVEIILAKRVREGGDKP